MSHELPKAYDPGAIETRWAEYWVRERLFHVETPSRPAHPNRTDESGNHTGFENRPVFTLILPPPNVTGRLHMGHMLNQTEMDIIIRWHRMRAFTTLWLPGTDHAGIATQMMVERQLATEGKSRRELGREAFIARVWDWKQHYGGAILEQMKRLGVSVDWSREYFTMDERMSRAVREAFVRLYDEGLIYRGKYIVNWCPRCVTAVSDLEVVHEETPGKLYQIRYPVIGSDEYIVVATTRPETMLGDTAVAVNSGDERYQHLHGSKVLLPLMNREIPIVTDDILANPEFGTGAVKVTPSHDPNDFEAGLRNRLPQIEVMNEVAQMNENAGPYKGLDRFEARKRVLEDLERGGFLVGTKDYIVPLAKCQRCSSIIEPRLSTQWFVKIQPLADRAIEVVEQGQIKFVPENYARTYFEWMRNIHDWCISRQLWWGHRIPAWHCKHCSEIIVSREAPSQCNECGGPLEQDSDVLDTWFSSGLLPCSALGWPEHTPDLDAFYPTTLLITSFDILFFWVARMIMMNCHFMRGNAKQDVPFETVYIHALVRDAEGQKMSKTKGNVVDPIEIIERYGTDAVRFTLAAMAAPGTDIAFSESRTESYRAFANKIWNAARFLFMNVDKAQQAGVWSLEEFRNSHNVGTETFSNGKNLPRGVLGFQAGTLEDRWILSRFNRVAQEIDAALATYRFHEAAHVVYHFFWGEFCDWYLELIKPRLASDDREQGRTACANLISIFEGALRMLSPFMPFITEELWHAVYDDHPPAKSIALVPYPQADAAQVDTGAETEMAILQDLVVSVRNIRAELKVEPKQKLNIEVFAQDGVRSLVNDNRGALARLANVEDIAFVGESLAKAAGARTTARFDVRVLYERKVDVAAERERLNKELAKLTGEMTRADAQLGNEAFLAKAPSNVVEGLRKRKAELELLIKKIKAALEQLGL